MPSLPLTPMIKQKCTSIQTIARINNLPQNLLHQLNWQIQYTHTHPHTHTHTHTPTNHEHTNETNNKKIGKFSHTAAPEHLTWQHERLPNKTSAQGKTKIKNENLKHFYNRKPLYL
jgi:primosomal protein N'